MSANLLPAAPYTAPAQPVDPASLTAAQIQAMLTAEAQGQAFTWNVSLKAIYQNSTFPSWLTNYTAGRDPNYLAGKAVVPPQPPSAFMVQPSDDGWGFTFPQVGDPVCLVPVYARIPPPQGTAPSGHAHVGNKIPSSPGLGWWSAPADNTAVEGQMTEGFVTADDGTVGIFQFTKGLGALFGGAGAGYWVLLAKGQ